MTLRFEISEEQPISINGNKATLYVNFFSSLGEESGVQYYEVDLEKFEGETNEEKIQIALNQALEAYECEKSGITGESEE